MEILSFSYKDIGKKWHLEKFSFFDFTLLVGASGVGKTKILKALHNLKRISLGGTVDHIEWYIKFKENNNVYIWEGKTDKDTSDKEQFFFEGISSRDESVVIIFERLIRVEEENKKVLFFRNNNDTEFSGTKVPKVHPSKSCIDIFSKEEEIEPVVKGFRKLFFFDFEMERHIEIGGVKTDKDLTSTLGPAEYNRALDALKRWNAPMVLKLALTFQHFESLFKEIKNDFINIFNYVEDIKFTVEEKIDSEGEERKNILVLQIKEYESDWISIDEISSGMLKTLLFIAMIYLVPRDSVIFIDEFENSLGMNCIDLTTSSIYSQDNVQFVITSHHPYIINKISMTSWKIVSRKKGRVIVKDAKDYNLGKSKHTAFKQLINLDVYTEGRETE